MGTTAKAIKPWSYQGLTPALNPFFSLPQVSEAVRISQTDMFNLEHGHLIDGAAIARFAVAAHEAQILSTDDLSVIDLYHGERGMYELSQKATTALGSRLKFKSRAIPKAKELVLRLAGEYHDPAISSSVALDLIERGLATANLFSAATKSNDTVAITLHSATEKALDDAFTSLAGGEVSMTPHIGNDSVYFQVSDFTVIDFNLPSLSVVGAHEFMVVLSKTLQACQTYLVPFHTPASYMGPSGCYAREIAESYDSLKERIKASTREELHEFLMTAPSEEIEVEGCPFGLEFYGDEDRDEDAVAMFVEALHEMEEMDEYFSGSISSNPIHHKTELTTVRSEAVMAFKNEDSPFKQGYEVIIKALDACLDEIEKGTPRLYESEFEGTADDGIGIMETIVMRANDVWELCGNEADECMDSYLQNQSEISLLIPVTQGVLPQPGVEIMERIGKCINLLRQISDALRTIEC